MPKHHLTFVEACVIYLKSVQDSFAVIPLQPSSSRSFFSRGVWYLNNVGGHIARVGCNSRNVL